MLQKHRTLISLTLYIITFWHNIQPQILDLLCPNTCSKNNKLYFFAKYYEKKYRDTDIYLKDVQTQTIYDIKNEPVLKSEPENIFADNISIETESHFSFDKEFKVLDNKIVYSTPCTVNNPLTIFDKLDQKNIDRYYDKIDKDNCHFLHHVQTQTISKEDQGLVVNKENIIEVTPKTIKYSYNCKKGRKSPKKMKRYKVFIVEIPTKGKKHLKKRVTFRDKERTVSTQLVESQENNFGDGNSSPSSVEQKTNFSTNTGGYIYDTFIGDYQNNTLYSNDTKMGFVKPTNSVVMTDNIADSLNVNINKSLDMYDRITKYGWTYTKSTPSIHNSPREVELIPDTYRICFDNDQLSHNSCSPLTTGEKKNNSVLDSLRKMKSRFMFWKETSPMKMKKCLSYEDVSPNVKYQKINKSSTCKSI